MSFATGSRRLFISLAAATIVAPALWHFAPAIHGTGASHEQTPPQGERAGLELSELAGLALTEGLTLKARRPSSVMGSDEMSGPDSLAERRALFALLQTGSEEDALRAIQQFAQ